MAADLLVENVRVVDGTGAPWFRGAVAVDEGRIDRLIRGRATDATAERRIDADGSVVCPGFVDAHSKSEWGMFANPLLEPKVRQGITTEIVGQDGFSMAPMDPDADVEAWQELQGRGEHDLEWSWGSTAAYLETLRDLDLGPNVGTLVGHGTVRFDVMGMAERAATEAERAEMRRLVDEALEAGALGLSTGLIYPPQAHSDTAELIEIASPLAADARPFVAHIRSEGRWLWEALDEFVRVGAEADVPLHLSHFKLSGAAQFGKADRAIGLAEAARERGIDFTANQYPYVAGSGRLVSVLPPRLLSADVDDLLEALRDEDVRERVRRDVEEWRVDGWENLGANAGWDNVVIASAEVPESDRVEGESVADIAAERGDDPVDVVCDLLVESRLRVQHVTFARSEDDVREIMGTEWVAVGTDGLLNERPHPRTYGAYPRVLGTYVREEGVLSLPDAIRKMTSLPARIYGLDRKGVLRPGMDADLVVFDPDVVASRASYDDPTRHPKGISHVIVDGTPVVADGEPTDARPGRVLEAGN